MLNGSKIWELDQALKSGARNNKYRILWHLPGGAGRWFDVLVHDVSLPGKTLGIAEVYLKGRKYQIAGERSDEGSISFTFYNDPNLSIRNLFLDRIELVHNFDAPNVMGGSVLASAESAINVYDQVVHNVKTVQEYVSQTNASGWYQGDVTIEQLGHQNDAVGATVVHNAFITEVGAIEYQDEVGDVSTTTVTLAFTDMTVS